MCVLLTQMGYNMIMIIIYLVFQRSTKVDIEIVIR